MAHPHLIPLVTPHLPASLLAHLGPQCFNPVDQDAGFFASRYIHSRQGDITAPKAFKRGPASRLRSALGQNVPNGSRGFVFVRDCASGHNRSFHEKLTFQPIALSFELFHLSPQCLYLSLIVETVWL